MPKQLGPGLLIVIEGIDGGGKTTLQSGLAEALRSQGHDVCETKEPTEGPLGQKIRALAQTGRSQVSAEEEFRLFHEDRKHHVETVVRPALARGEIVIQDRSYFSTVAYQGERGLDRDDLLEKSRQVAPEPDVLLLVDLEPQMALDRIRQQRGQETDDFEKLDSLTRIRTIFHSFAQAKRLDARNTPGHLLSEALNIVQSALKAGRSAKG